MNMQYDLEMYDELWSKDWQNLQEIGPLTHNRYRLMLKELPKEIKPDSQIIDVGCGRGSFLELLKNRYPSATFTGVEYSDEGKQAARPDLRNSIIVGDIYDVVSQLPHHYYDILVCSEVLEHLPDPDKALELIASIIKPGGIALLTVPCGMGYWSTQDKIAGHYRRFEYSEFASLVKNNNFTLEKHYSWGTLFGLLYYRAVSLVGPSRVMKTKPSLLSHFISRVLQILFHVDDFFVSSQGFQLITRARHL